MFQFFLRIIYILGIIGTVWYMKTWNSSKFLWILLIFLVWFLSLEYLITPKPKMCPRRQNVLIPVICIKLWRVFFFIQIYLPEVTRTKTWKSRTAWTYLDLDITIEVNLYVYKLSEKRDKVYFFVVRMPVRLYSKAERFCD